MLPQCGRSLKDPHGREVTANSLRSMRKCWRSSKERSILVFRHLARRGVTCTSTTSSIGAALSPRGIAVKGVSYWRSLVLICGGIANLGRISHDLWGSGDELCAAMKSNACTLSVSRGAAVSNSLRTLQCSPAPGLWVDLPSLHLQPDFTRRVRSLPANTMLHIPSSCRLRVIAATALCWQGMFQGSNESSMLEEGKSKLLLASVCPGLGAADEVAKRLTLGNERRFRGPHSDT